MTDDGPRAQDAGGEVTKGGDPTLGPRPPGRPQEWLQRLGVRSDLARDGLLAVAVALVSSVILWALVDPMAEVEGIRLSPAATSAFTAVMCAQSLLLWARRRYPVLCLAAVVLLQVVIVAMLPMYTTVQGLAPFVAAYTCGALLPTRRLVWTLAAVTVGHGVIGGLVTGMLVDPALVRQDAPTAVRPDSGEVTWLIGGLLLSALVVYVGFALLGAFVATRRRYVDLLRERAAEAVQRQRERAEGAIMAERARMARELHDIAAHHLSGMVVQAGAAERLIGRDDRAAREATAWVRAQGRETLDSLRMVVGALREPGEEPASTGDALAHTGDPGSRGAPVPGAAALDRLVGTERDLGAAVDLVREGEPYDLPPVADVTVYRVAREALSNAREHAPGAPVRVTLAYAGTRVVLEVDNGPRPDGGAASGADTGRGSDSARASLAPRGLGLLGMRERAQLVNAELAAGPTARGGWRIRLDLPVGREVTAGREHNSNKEDAR
ncbi:sensor histidine kinase [Nocardiopsis sp. Huas11]|uniref:sensor histidine kinase n=1 Tax=Nocardiopsis sp. Huas11 TaxID=2183912 RepID=UPI0011C3FBA5|nr:histidine kinase [Nocardiopsis sp. Huas11]